MQKGPILLRVKKEDPLLTTTHRLIIAIGSQQFAMDMTTTCTELKPSRAEVIPIDGHFQKGPRKPMGPDAQGVNPKVILREPGHRAHRDRPHSARKTPTPSGPISVQACQILNLAGHRRQSNGSTRSRLHHATGNQIAANACRDGLPLRRVARVLAGRLDPGPAILSGDGRTTPPLSSSASP